MIRLGRIIHGRYSFAFIIVSEMNWISIVDPTATIDRMPIQRNPHYTRYVLIILS